MQTVMLLILLCFLNAISSFFYNNWKEYAKLCKNYSCSCRDTFLHFLMFSVSIWSIRFCFTENTVKCSVLVHLNSFSFKFILSELQYYLFFFLYWVACYSLAHFFSEYLKLFAFCYITFRGFVLLYLFLLANETSSYLIPMLPPLSVYSW